MTLLPTGPAKEESHARYKQTRRRHGGNRFKEETRLHRIILQDPVIKRYLTVVANRRRNNGFVSHSTTLKALSGTKHLLRFLGIPITDHALTDLITETRRQHRKENFATDDKLLEFVGQKPIMSYASWGASIKGIFKANRCPLQASFNTTFTHSTKKIGSGLLKAIYGTVSTEEQKLMESQAYAGERLAAVSLTPISQWEDFDNRYTLIHIKACDTKARNEHVCIIPRSLADWLRDYCKQTNRDRPFPNCRTLWHEITQVVLTKFGIHLSSHYLRKRFHTVAGKTAMPVNSWDYLMGDRQTHGHSAGTYTLEDFSELVQEYDRYLAPHLSINEPIEPDEPKEPCNNKRLEALLKENADLKEQILKLSKLLIEGLANRTV